MSFQSGSFLGVSFVGTSNLMGYSGQPVIRPYKKLTIFGEATFDDVHAMRGTYSLEDIQALDISVEDEYTIDTIYLASFENENLAAGNVIGLSEPVLLWEVNRRQNGSSVLTKVGDIENVESEDALEFTDKTVTKNESYEYVIFGISENEVSEPLVSNSIDTYYDAHILIGEDTEDIYVLNLNLESSNVSNITDYNRYDGYDKYSAHSFGKRDFESSIITAILGDVSEARDGIIQTISDLSDFRAFINNGKPKIYKSQKGEIYRVVTTETSRQVLSDKINGQPYVVSFKWEEIGRLV
jgi:hypothetical protein